MARVDAAPVSVVMLTYTAPLDAIDDLLPAHVAWLERAIDEGVLLLAGRQAPRVGGVLLFRGRRAEVEALAATDPFVAGGAATFVITEMAASFANDEIARLIA